MARIYFITHPEVMIDPAMPVTDWPLSPLGRERMRLSLGRSWASDLRAIFSSAEQKARDAAAILAGHLGLMPTIIGALGENDRSATGYLPRVEFEWTADEFFAHPERSVHGWERAADAQQRIVGAIENILASTPVGGDLAIISHGAVGALLLCHLKGVPINRSEDQPGGGGGNLFSFDAETRQLVSGWSPIEA